MGSFQSFIGRHIELHMDRENNPEPEGPITFDPHFGFEGQRQPRGIKFNYNLKKIVLKIFIKSLSLVFSSENSRF